MRMMKQKQMLLREVAWKGREGQANEGGTGGGERNTTAPEKVIIPGKNDPSPHISKAQSWALSQSREERGPLEQGNIRGGIPLRRWPCT